MQVRVSFTDDRNFAESLSSAPTGAVAAAANNSATGAPTISGPAGLGVTLIAGVTAIADEDGLTNAVFGYQWIRHDGNTGTDISGATASNYTLATADVGKTLTVKVSFTDDRGNEESLTSAATAAVASRGVVWSADMLVVDYKTGAIGADSPDLFSNFAGSAGFGGKVAVVQLTWTSASPGIYGESCRCRGHDTAGWRCGVSVSGGEFRRIRLQLA